MEREPISKYFRLALKEILGPGAQRGVQVRLAGAAGISASYLNDVIKGRAEGSEDVRRAISKAVEQSYEQMIDRGRELAESPKDTKHTVSTNDKVSQDLQWILTGKKLEQRGHRVSILNTELLRKTIFEVEEGLSRKAMTLDPAKKSRLISILYEYSVTSGKSAMKKVVDNYLDLLE